MSSFFHLAVYCSHKPSHLPSFVFFRTICSVLHLGQRRKDSAPLSFSIPRTAIKQRLWERQFDKIHLKVRQSGKVVMSGYNRLFAAIAIHIVPNRHTGEQGMYWDKINNKGDYHSVPDPDLEIRGGGGRGGGVSRKHFSALRASVHSKNKGGPPWIYHCHFSWCKLLVSLVPVSLLLSSMAVLWHVND